MCAPLCFCLQNRELMIYSFYLIYIIIQVEEVSKISLRLFHAFDIYSMYIYEEEDFDCRVFYSVV